MTGIDRRLGSSVLVVFGCVLAIACGDSTSPKAHGATTGGKPDAGPPRVKVRTVSVELMPFAERTLSEDADGGLVWGALTDLEGVKVCLWKQRPQLASFEDFVSVEGPCHTSGAGGKVPRFEGLPANSELVFEATKDGFEPLAMPFVTYEHDFVPPTVVSGARYAMLRVGARDPWLEPPGPGTHDGVAAVSASMDGQNSKGVGASELGSPPGVGSIAATKAAGVQVRIQSKTGDRTRVVMTLSERPRWLALSEGEYRVTFSHPRASCMWWSEPLLLPRSGYPAAETGVVRVPIFAGHHVIIDADCWCDVERKFGIPTDLPTCSFADAGP
jgi:hypothetical protein